MHNLWRSDKGSRESSLRWRHSSPWPSVFQNGSTFGKKGAEIYYKLILLATGLFYDLYVSNCPNNFHSWLIRTRKQPNIFTIGSISICVSLCCNYTNWTPCKLFGGSLTFMFLIQSFVCNLQCPDQSTTSTSIDMGPGGPYPLRKGGITEKTTPFLIWWNVKLPLIVQI